MNKFALAGLHGNLFREIHLKTDFLMFRTTVCTNVWLDYHRDRRSFACKSPTLMLLLIKAGNVGWKQVETKHLLLDPWCWSYLLCRPAGPRRVNHASVSIGDFVYSFGGYCSGEDYRLSRPMDVHVLNTNNLRWSLLPTKKDKKYPNVPFQRYGKPSDNRIGVET